MRITGTVIGGEEAVARFKAMPTRLRIELSGGIARAALRLQAYVKGDKLSGGVLKVRTGRLRRSINERVIEETNKVTGIVGTNVEYAAVHEYGFTGTENVRAHLRQLKSGATQNVRAHTRTVHMPERSFLRSALKDMAPEIRAEFEAALGRAMRQ